MIPSKASLAMPAVMVATLGQAAGAVVLGHDTSPQGAVLNTFIAFAAAALLSVAALSRRRGVWPRLYRRLMFTTGSSWSLLLVLATCGAFGGFYVAISLIDPVAVSALEAGMGPVLTLFVFSAGKRAWVSFAAPVLMLLLAVSVAVVVLGGSHEAGRAPGLLLTMLVGFSGVMIVLSSRRLGEAGFSVHEVNVVRFVGSGVVLGFICLIVLLRDGARVPEGTNVGVALVFIALPFLVLQYGIVRGDPVRNELVMSSLPALVFLGDALRSFDWSPWVGLLMLVSLGVAYSGAFLEARLNHPSLEEKEQNP